MYGSARIGFQVSGVRCQGWKASTVKHWQAAARPGCFRQFEAWSCSKWVVRPWAQDRRARRRL